MIDIKYNPKKAYKLMHEGTLALSLAEQQGIRVNMEYCKKAKEEITKKIEKLENDFFQTKLYKHWLHSSNGKVNIYSNAQLSWFLYKKKNIKPAYTTANGQGATDEDSLKQLNIPEIEDLIRIRKLKKIRDTYLDAFIREQVNGYIHPSFNLHLVQTFRSSSDRPNFQNIPKRDKEAMEICRKALYARPGNILLEVDYGALEVKIAACYHQDPTMLKYITDPKSDMHRDMAQQIFFIESFNKKNPIHKTLRSAAKGGFVFPQFYGDYYKNCATNISHNWCGLSKHKWTDNMGISFNENISISKHFKNHGINSISQFTEHIRVIENDFWNNRFPVYKQWKEDWYDMYRKNGYIDMLTGFRCTGFMRKNEAINYPVQGSAFHCLLWSFIHLDKILKQKRYKSRLIGQIHDAIVIDVDPSELNDVCFLLKKTMTIDLPKAWEWIIVPLDIEIDISEVGGSWADMKTIDIS